MLIGGQALPYQVQVIDPEAMKHHSNSETQHDDREKMLLFLHQPGKYNPIVSFNVSAVNNDENSVL